MTYKSSAYRYSSSSKVSNRYKQFLVLIGTIIFGMIVSSVINAIPSSRVHSVAKESSPKLEVNLSTRN